MCIHEGSKQAAFGREFIACFTSRLQCHKNDLRERKRNTTTAHKWHKTINLNEINLLIHFLLDELHYKILLFYFSLFFAVSRQTCFDFVSKNFVSSSSLSFFSQYSVCHLDDDWIITNNVSEYPSEWKQRNHINLIFYHFTCWTQHESSFIGNFCGGKCNYTPSVVIIRGVKHSSNR